MSDSGTGGFTLFTRSTVDEKQLDPEVRAELGGLYEATEQLNAKLREELADLRAERDVLQTRVEGLDAENDTLADRLEGLATEVDRVAREAAAADDVDTEAFTTAVRAEVADLLDREETAEGLGVRPGPVDYLPTVKSVAAPRVLADFALAADEADAAAADSGFAVADLSVTLRTGVRHDDGVAFQLPGLVSADTTTLSDVSFAVRPRSNSLAGTDGEEGFDPSALREVPPLVGRSLTAAREAVADAGFTVGAVTEDDGDPGRVADQLPSAYALAEPGAPIDLTVGRTHEDAATADGTSLQGTRPTADAEDDLEARLESTAAEDETLDGEPDDLQRIDGIGPTYADRLTSAGIDTFDALAAAAAERVAEAANTSVARASDWIAAAEQLSAERR